MFWTLLLSLCTFALANETKSDALNIASDDLIIDTPTPLLIGDAVDATLWKGRFRIEGFSFKGAVPGTITFGPTPQMEIRFQRPSGLPIMSLTVLEEEICVLFDLDGVQYRGTHAEFASLSKGVLPAETIHLVFKPNKENQPEGWDWYSTPRSPIRILDVDNADGDFLNAGYKGWTKRGVERGPGRIYVHLGPNEWTLRANIQKRSTTIWSPSCEVDETISVRPLSEMLEALPK